MALNWVEIALIVALNAVIYVAVMSIMLRLAAPRLLSRAEQWMGGTIGRFMANLSAQATAEEGGLEGAEGGGGLNLGGIKIDANLIQSIGGILDLLKNFGLIKGGGGGGTGKFGL